MGENLTSIEQARVADIVAGAIGEPLALKAIGDAGKPAIFLADTLEGQYFVRVLKADCLQSVKYENELVSFAAESDVDCVSESSLLVSGSGYLVAWRPWIRGVVRNSIQSDCAERAGSNLGKLHTSCRRNFRPPFFQYHNFCSISHKKWDHFLNVASQDVLVERHIVHQFLESSMDCITHFHDKFDYLFTCESIVHGDVHAGNMVINGDKLYLLDWESSGLGSAIVDLSVANYHLCFAAHEPCFMSHFSNPLVRGYLKRGLPFSREDLTAGLVVSGISYFVHDFMGLVLTMRGDLDRHVEERARNHFSFRVPEFVRFLEWCAQIVPNYTSRTSTEELEFALMRIAEKYGVHGNLRTARSFSLERP